MHRLGILIGMATFVFSIYAIPAMYSEEVYELVASVVNAQNYTNSTERMKQMEMLDELMRYMKNPKGEFVKYKKNVENYQPALIYFGVLFLAVVKIAFVWVINYFILRHGKACLSLHFTSNLYLLHHFLCCHAFLRIKPN